MNNQTEVLDQILYQGLRPWLENNSLDEKFASKLSSVKETSTVYPFRYEIKFHRPFNYKTKYYSKLILNSVKSDFVRLHDLIREDDNDKLKKYWLDDTLNKRLKTRLKDLGKLIKEKDFSLAYIDPQKTSFELDQNHKADSYIMQLLKLAYMQLYLEIQDVFASHIEDKIILEDLFTQMLLEKIPDQFFLSPTQSIEIKALQVTDANQEEKLKEIPYNSFLYNQLNKSPDKINDLCDSLKKNKFIHKDTSLPNFKKVFSGSEIKTPIIWTGNISELYYFIKLIHNDFKFVENLKQKQWEVTCHCFLQENKEPFERSKFRSLKKPSLTGGAIEKAVELLK